MMQRFKSKWGRQFGILELRRAYNMVFRSPISAELVLPDISDFCRSTETAPIQSDLFIQGRFAGRQDVWKHISEYLNLTEDELYNLRRGQSIEVIRSGE